MGIAVRMTQYPHMNLNVPAIQSHSPIISYQPLNNQDLEICGRLCSSKIHDIKLSLYLGTNRFTQWVSVCFLQVSAKNVKSNMHPAMYRATPTFCSLDAWFTFWSPCPFLPDPGSVSPLPQLPRCYHRRVLLQRHQRGSGKAQSSRAVPPLSETVAHVQTTTGMPETRGRDKRQKGWLITAQQAKDGDAEPEPGQTPHFKDVTRPK